MRNLLKNINKNQVVIILLILVSCAATLVTGILTSTPMIGDEVTHYYMLKGQVADLARPNFWVKIPVGYADDIVRLYAHPFGWHYFGAIFSRATVATPAAVQFYHSVYWLQLLVACYLLAKSRKRASAESTFLYVLVMATLPAGILFSVAFYQDIPMTAQIVSAWLMLVLGHWFLAVLFMVLALFIKVNAFVYYPVFLVLLFWFSWRNHAQASRWLPMVLRRRVVVSLLNCTLALSLFAGASCGMHWMLQKYAQADFFPFIAARRMVENVELLLLRTQPKSVSAETLSDSAPQSDGQSINKSERVYDVIANHPGDLRFWRNWVTYFGGIVWCVVLLGLIGLIWDYYKRRFSAKSASRSSVFESFWPFIAGLGYLIPTAFMLKTAPDARFFIPMIPLLLLPFCEWCDRLPFRRAIICILLLAGLLQAGLVYHKTYELRKVPQGIEDAIEYLEQNMPSPPRIFMYPEGNYRLFPCDHEWYLSYGLRDFWRGSNDLRLDMLKRHSVGAIVIKKHLIAPLDEQMHNLGIYPSDFVEDISRDDRFKKTFENKSVIVFSIP